MESSVWSNRSQAVNTRRGEHKNQPPWAGGGYVRPARRGRWGKDGAATVSLLVMTALSTSISQGP